MAGKPVHQDKLPQALEQERAVLGSVLLNEKLYPDAAAGLSPDDFSIEKHRKIFKAFTGLYEVGEHIDTITLTHFLDFHRELQACDGLTYLVTLTDGLPRVPHIDSYIRGVKEASRLRKLIFASQNVVNQALSGIGTSSELIANTEEVLISLRPVDGEGALNPEQIVAGHPGGISEFLDPSLRKTGLETGWTKVDQMTSGLQPGESWIIGARPSQGKTSILLNIAERRVLSEERKRVVIFSIEMSREPLLQRMMCSVARIDFHRFRMGMLSKDERGQLNHALHDLMSSNLLIDDTTSLSVMDIRSNLTRIIRRHGPIDLVGIDYLQLMTSKQRAENRNQEVTAISRGIKLTAKDFNVPILTLSQLSRPTDKRAKGVERPQLHHLRESGSIEQDADTVALIHRPEVYDRTREEYKGLMEFIIAKQRNGPIGIVNLAWIGSYMKAENRSESTPDSESEPQYNLPHKNDD